MKRHTLHAFSILSAVALTGAATVFATPPAQAQQARCATGFVEVYLEYLRESRCMSEAQLRSQSLRRQQNGRGVIARRQQQELRTRMELTGREQQRLTQPPQ